MPDFQRWLEEHLAELDAAHLRRHLRILDGPQGGSVTEAGLGLVNFASNDYLGLAADPRLRDAARMAIDRWGVGAGASRLISGTLRPHAELEEAIASFKTTGAALVFSNGTAAATGAIPALVGAGDIVILDKLAHACLVDGARSSGATLRVYPHNHLDKLESHLKWARASHPDGIILVITESVFSMDGDLAPLREIVALKNRFDAWLFLDEAHGIGVIGEHGRGLAWECGLADQVEIQMGTLGKALGASGGYLAGSPALIAWLVNRARPFIFSTAPPACIAAAALEAIRILESDAGESLRQKLWENIRAFSEAASSAIVPVIIGEPSRAVDAANRLKERGFWVPAVRYPTVAKNSARLRVTLSAAHTPAQIAALRDALPV